MTMAEATPGVEFGPIRPPSEARSLFLRVTRNCPWNRCLFCPVYKRRKFSRRARQEVLADIDTLAEAIGRVRDFSLRLGRGGAVDDEVYSQLRLMEGFNETVHHVAVWLYFGEGSVFLQDANNFILPAEEIIAVLEHLRRRVPGITRVTTYARSKSVGQKTLEQLKAIRAAGLDRLHIGLETGHDPLLKFMRKGVSAAEQIEAGRKAVAAGLELSEYVMPGLGGREMSRGHAIDTAKALNAIDPHFIRLRTLRVPRRTELFQELSAGRFTMLSDDECVGEIRLFVDSLEGISSFLASDHIMNLVETVQGRLPGDKPRLLAELDAYLGLPDEERLIYRFGRRAGLFRGPGDLALPGPRTRASAILQEARRQRPGQEEAALREMADSFV